MVQEASLDTLALAGAMVAFLFAGLTFAFARRRDATPALTWWAAAFAVEALRLALMSAASFPPGARAELIGEGGHALVAIPLLIGALRFFGKAPRRRLLLALACLPVVAMLAGLLDPRASEPAAAALTAFAAAVLALTAWLFWRHYRAARQAWILGAAATPALLALLLLGDALRSLGFDPTFERSPSGEWGLLVHLALPLLTMTSLVFVTQRHAYQVRLEAEDRLAASEQRFRESKLTDGGTVTAWSDITWLRRRAQALALLVESDRDDRSFFDVAAEALAVGLGYRWSGIGYRRDDERFEALATRGPGWPEGVPSYGLDVTPGGRVVESRGYLSFADRVAERFPDDTILAELGVVSYQGQAFLDAEGNPLGHVFAMNDRPDKPGPHDRELVGLIARWVGAEFEQRRIEAALAESEQRFRDYAETGADWFWETDMDQRFTSHMESEAATASTHITIGKTREEIHRGINAVPEVAPIIAGYMARGEAFRNLEFRSDDPELGTRWIRVSGKPVLAPDGRPVGYRGTGRDVTAHREAVAALRGAERHVRSIVENVADALVTIDQRGTIQSINPATERLFGYAADELIGENVAVLMPAPHRIEHDNYIRRYLATGTAGILGINAREVLGRRKDGTPVEVELTASEMWHGGARLFIGVMRDITERKAAEEALRQKTDFVELSKSVAAAANEALSVEDALQACVSEVCTHFGWPIGHVYLLAGDGTDELAPSTIWHLSDREKFGAFCSITMATRFAPGIGMPGRILVSREPIWIADVTEDSNFMRARASENIGIKAAFGVPVLVGSEVAAVLEFFAEEAIEPDRAAFEVMAHIGKHIGRVIERERADRQLLAAKDTAERADRAKGEFLASMSHELRTPLNAIIGFSEIMGQELFGPMGHPTYKEYTDDIRTSGTHLLNIINDILESPRPRPA